MGTRLRPLGHLALLAALGLALGACDTSPRGWLEELRGRLTGAGGAPAPMAAAPAPAPAAPAAPVAAPTPAPAGPAQPAAPDAGAPRLALSGERRFAGGRRLDWWSERLARLRRDGPAELYRLTAARARLAGLDVAEQASGEVTVRAAPLAEARK